MGGQNDPKFLDRGGEFLFCQRVYGVLHGIGGKDFAVVSFCMDGVKVSLQRYVYGDMAYLVPVRMADDPGQVDGIFAVSIGVEANSHISI